MSDTKSRRWAGLAPCLAVAGLVAAGYPAAGVALPPPHVKIVTKHEKPPAPPLETTVYLQTDRTRRESRNLLGIRSDTGEFTYVDGPLIATITRCDIQQRVVVDLSAREYSVDELAAAEPAPAPESPRAAEATPNPTLLIETSTVDTGERRDFFGYTARHVVTTRKQSPLEGGHSDPSEIRTDGWYIDLDSRLACERAEDAGRGRIDTFLTFRAPGEPPEIPSFKETGTPETGYPIEVVSTSRLLVTMPDGTVRDLGSSWSQRVAEFSTAPQDPALFDVPAGFRNVTPWSIRIRNAWRRLTR